MTFESWLIFMAIWIAASIPLGPNALNCISSTVSYGLRKGLWTVLGVFIASILHMMLALSGIAVFFNANPVIFELLRWLGVGYLVWMGVGMLRSKGRFEVQKNVEFASNSKLVRRGILISMSNPKAIFVWLAIFTQFIRPDIALGPQLLILAPSALAVTIIVYLAYSALGLGVNRIFAGSRKKWFDRIAGSTYLAFAIGLASAGLRRA